MSIKQRNADFLILQGGFLTTKSNFSPPPVQSRLCNSNNHVKWQALLLRSIVAGTLCPVLAFIALHTCKPRDLTIAQYM